MACLAQSSLRICSITVAEQVHFQREVEHHRQPAVRCQACHTWPLVRIIHFTPSLTAYICTWRKHLAPSLVAARLTSMNATSCRGDPHPVAGEFPLDLVFGVVFVFVVAGPIAREIGDQQPGVTLITRVLPAFTGSGGLANSLFL